MSAPVSVAVAAATPLARGSRTALQAAVRHVSWRVVGTALAIMIALDAWLVVETVNSAGPWLGGAEG